jgi:hypothetical protein
MERGVGEWENSSLSDMTVTYLQPVPSKNSILLTNPPAISQKSAQWQMKKTYTSNIKYKKNEDYSVIDRKFTTVDRCADLKQYSTELNTV